MDDKQRYDEGLKVRRAALGDAYVEGSLARRTEFNTEFQDFITRYAWGEIWTRPGFERRTRSLLTMAMLMAQGREAEFRLHVRAASNNGVTHDDLKELFLQAAIYCGVPTANSAFATAAEVFAEMEQDTKGG